MRRLTRGLEPFPTPRIAAVTIGGKRASGDPSSYLRLFAVESAGTARYDADADYALVDLLSRRPSPWTDGRSEFAFSPRTKSLERGPDLIRLRDDLAADLAAGRTLGAPDERALLPWLVAAALAAALLALAALARLARRRAADAEPVTVT